jgi:hypothetical protein
MDMATVQAFSDAREGTGKTFTGVGLGNAAPAARPPAPGQLSRARSPGSPAAASGPCSSRSRQSCTARGTSTDSSGADPDRPGDRRVRIDQGHYFAGQ